LDEHDEPWGHASIGADQPWKALGENLVRASRGATDEFPHREQQQHVATGTGQIGNGPLIVPVDARRDLMALWARHAWSMAPHANDELSGTGMNRGERDCSREVQDGGEPRCLSGFH